MDQPPQASETEAESASVAADAEDDALLTAARRKDEQASAPFVRRHYGRMLGTASRLVGDAAPAEDVPDHLVQAILAARDAD